MMKLCWLGILSLMSLSAYAVPSTPQRRASRVRQSRIRPMKLPERVLSPLDDVAKVFSTTSKGKPLETECDKLPRVTSKGSKGPKGSNSVSDIVSSKSKGSPTIPPRSSKGPKSSKSSKGCQEEINTSKGKLKLGTCARVALETLVTGADSENFIITLDVVAEVDSIDDLPGDIRQALQRSVAPGLTNCKDARRRLVSSDSKPDNVVFGSLTVDSTDEDCPEAKQDDQVCVTLSGKVSSYGESSGVEEALGKKVGHSSYGIDGLVRFTSVTVHPTHPPPVPEGTGTSKGLSSIVAPPSRINPDDGLSPIATAGIALIVLLIVAVGAIVILQRRRRLQRSRKKEAGVTIAEEDQELTMDDSFEREMFGDDFEESAFEESVYGEVKQHVEVRPVYGTKKIKWQPVEDTI